MKMLGKIATAASIVLLSAAYWTSWLWFGGITPAQTARILIEDVKFGDRALGMAHWWGDSILEPLQRVSRNFQLLHGRNAFWVADVIANSQSARGRALARSLYERELSKAKLVGAVGMAAQGTLSASEFSATGVLHRILTEDSFLYKPYSIPPPNDRQATTKVFGDTTILELALVAAKYAKSTESVPDIVAIIAKTPAPGTVHAKAIEALVSIGDRRAIPALVDAMGSPDFRAFAEATRALVAFGDDRAIPLAIERITTPENHHWSPVASELEKLTGQKFGTNKQLWREWWASHRSSLNRRDMVSGLNCCSIGIRRICSQRWYVKSQ